MQLVIAEKPSVAKSYAGVLGANIKKDGYFEGNGYLVTWCIGHLIELLLPNSYDDKYKIWNVQTLPIMPDKWLYGVKKETKKQYDIVKQLLNSNEITEVVCATDAGREGELIFRNVYEYCGCKKPIKRLWISSMVDSAIKDGFDNLCDGRNYDDLFYAAQARERADWLTGMNLSRLFTLQYGGGKKLSIGRVMTPTLSMIVDRDYQISNFVKEKYYVVHCRDNNGIDAVSKQFSDKLEAKTLCDRLKGDEAKVVAVDKEKKKKDAPLLYDLTSLQRECNRTLGFSADKTLTIAQELYEKKLTTYPRTDAKYISSDMRADIEKVFDYSKNMFDFVDDNAKPLNPQRIVNDAKITDHHAIIPTCNNVEIKNLNEDSMKVYQMICLRFVAALSQPYEYESVKIIVECDREKFTQTGTVIINEGYRFYEKQYKNRVMADKEESEKVLPCVDVGYTFMADFEFEEKETKPLQHYTEDTLLSAMERAGNKEMSDEVERKGLGTSATRASVIEKLISLDYVRREKKKLIATDEGKYLVSVVPEVVKSVELTCDWENELLEVSKGNKSYSSFMDSTKEFISNIVNEYKNIVPAEERRAEDICECPVCSKGIRKGKYGIYCSGKCGISFKVFGVHLTETQVKKLVGENKEVLCKGLKSKKGTEYDAYIKYEGTEKYEFTSEDGTRKAGYNIKVSMRFPEKKN